MLALWAFNRNLTPLQLSSRTEQNDNGDEDKFESLPDEVQQLYVNLHAVLASVNEGTVASDTAGESTYFNYLVREILGGGAVEELKPFQWAENYTMRYALDGSPVAADNSPLIRGRQGEFVSDCKLIVEREGHNHNSALPRKRAARSSDH